jgi:DNA repair exonuclease SbcCD ATPase subunit
MKIISLQAENVKRLSAVEITPDGKSIIIAGQNAQGKSSVLDSILYALAGKDALPERPIRDGESHASIKIDLGDYQISRTLTATGGGVLKITKQGEKGSVSSPQAVLDGLIGTLTFDPLEFSRLKSKEQSRYLQEIIGIDLAKLDAERKVIYDKRHSLGQQVEILKGKLAGRTRNPDVPAEEVDSSELGKKQRAHLEAQHQVQMAITQRDSLQEQMDRLRAGITRTEKEWRDAVEVVSTARKAYDVTSRALEGKSILQLDGEIARIGQINKAVAENRDFDSQVIAFTDLDTQYADLTCAIANHDEDRKEKLLAAEFPVDGLGFTSEGEVVFNKIPFAQLSTSEKIKVSASIAIALNPKIRVMLIRDGSLLDETALRDLIVLADEKDAQIWIERVGVTGHGSSAPVVVIEDGGVA